MKDHVIMFVIIVEIRTLILFVNFQNLSLMNPLTN